MLPGHACPKFFWRVDAYRRVDSRRTRCDAYQTRRSRVWAAALVVRPVGPKIRRVSPTGRTPGGSPATPQKLAQEVRDSPHFYAGFDGGALVVAGGVMASSDDSAASSLGRVSART